jgi:hypothetical protein
MTAPTPDQSIKMIEATIRDLRFQSAAYETGDDAAFTNSVADMIEALSADRDQARQLLADAPHAESCVANVWTDDEQPFDARPCDCWKAGL